jgi:hypothetical protein
MIRRLTLLAITLTTVALAGSFMLSRAYGGVIGSLLVGLVWALAVWRNWFGMASWGLVTFVILAGFGAANEYYAILDAFAVVSALSAWDLSRFEQRLKIVENESLWTDMTRHHVRRLLLVSGVGLLITIPAIQVQVGGTFILAWLLGISLVAALFVFVLWIAKSTQ